VSLMKISYKETYIFYLRRMLNLDEVYQQHIDITNVALKK
jgi:hypothetical protein